ncbi:acyl-CoA thioesterase [Paludibacterium paludis]|uniref:Acyl-CoA thioesterase FadM n=1 Tax=Paludibacterium paludis TaxID=1225769 RepID=A0A918P4A1_9NEIS|nr:thioesterase family protein [Paludibacterium paludis]GGY20493.1 hypothetical protein GCM10011289_25080 [Paludibacterium paludis]
MARVEIPLPDTFLFETALDIRVGDINYGGHMGNDAILTLAQEARIRFLRQSGYTEMDVDGVGIIMADAAIRYIAEARHGDRLRFRIGIGDLSRCGLELIYQATDDRTGKEVARLKTGIVFFDYGHRKVVPIPESFAARFCR